MIYLMRAPENFHPYRKACLHTNRHTDNTEQQGYEE